MTSKTRSNETVASLTSTVDSPNQRVKPWSAWKGGSYSDNVPEEYIDDTPTRARKSNATLFSPGEMSGTSMIGTSIRGRWKDLHKHNLDVFPYYRADINHSSRVDYETKMEIMIALGNQLELNQFHITKATRKLYSIDVPRTGHPTAVVGFCLYTHLLNKTTKEYENRTQSLYNKPSPGKTPIYWPGRGPEKNDVSFQRVADNLVSFYQNVSKNVLLSILQKLLQGGLPVRESGGTPMVSEILS